MPKMTNRWRNAAIVMAILGFVAVALTAQFVVTDPGCVMNAPNCLRHFEFPLNTLAGAAVNAAIWFGIVYLVFLVTYGLQKAARGGSKPPPALPSHVEESDSDKPEISHES